ncbi:MAG: hypothetical protein WBL50_28195 [Candidatus Acidiferrum sp.]
MSRYWGFWSWEWQEAPTLRWRLEFAWDRLWRALGLRRLARTDTTAIIHTLALRTDITGLIGLLAAYLSGLVRGITDTMGRAVSTAVRVMDMAIGLDMGLGRDMVITRRLPTDSLAADMPQRVTTVVLASASMAAVVSTVAAVAASMVVAVPTGNLL